MCQLHKRFSSEQVKMILDLYIQKKMELREVLSQLEIKERRFYKILAQYKNDKVNFSIDYGRDQANYRITGRRVNGYHQISWQGKILNVKKDIPIGALVDLKSIRENTTPELRLWHENKLKQVFRFIKS